MAESSLFEILGILIGFAGIMLVLSLLVTALTQSVIGFWGIRAANLRAGLEELLASARQEGAGAALARARKECDAKHVAETRARAKVESLRKIKADQNEIAGEDANLAEATLAYEEAKEKLAARTAEQDTDQRPKDNYNPGKLARKILNSNSLMKPGRIRYLPARMWPKASWIMKEELEILLHDDKDICDESIETVMSWFSRMERGLSQRFNTIAKVITLVCALLVAIVFQVSAPDVLKRLSTDPQYRARAEMTAAGLLEKHEVKQLQQMEIMFQDVSAGSLDQLQKNHSDMRETLEEVSGIGRTKEDILSELALVLEDDPQREALVSEYESILDELRREKYERAVKAVEDSVSALALFDIVPLSHGIEFYWDIGHALGILMTTILISLGAPFWFGTLRKLVNLRDTLAPEESKKDGDRQTH